MSAVPFSYPDPQTMFQIQYQAMRRDEVVGVLLAIFLGGFGIHHFYLGRTGWGIFYCCFCWTPIPWILGWIECFFMPARVQAYNASRAVSLAAALGLTLAPYPVYPTAASAYAPQASTAQAGVTPQGTLVGCPACAQVNVAGSRFCAACGKSLS